VRGKEAQDLLEGGLGKRLDADVQGVREKEGKSEFLLEGESFLNLPRNSNLR